VEFILKKRILVKIIDVLRVGRLENWKWQFRVCFLFAAKKVFVDFRVDKNDSCFPKKGLSSNLAPAKAQLWLASNF
jgi:hypothetical protein